MKTGVKHKRGIPIQSRIIISAVLIFLQLAFLFAVLFVFYDYFFPLYILQQIAGIVMVAFLINRRWKKSYNTAWIIFILIFPIFGICVYLLCGGERVLPHLKRKMRRCEEKYLPLLPEDRAVHAELKKADDKHYRQAHYLSRATEYPLYKNSSVEYLSPGEKFLPRFLEELEKAKEYIFLEFFIVAEGEMWEAVYEILKRKAANGVDVRLLFDDFGSIKRQHKDFINRLESVGIKVAVFNKIKPSVNMFFNNRNHRKTVVIDGLVAATGGLNLADEYINEFERFGYWMDCAVIVKGSAVKSFLSMFCSMWEFSTDEELPMRKLIKDAPVKSEGFVLPYCDDPLDHTSPSEGIYLRIISNAQKYVYITTPYLIIDDIMLSALKIAAQSGVDVRILTPHIPDKKFVHPVTQYNYLELLESGVRIYEYTPGFIHSKLVVSDDTVATAGTVNMDYRSFVLHFECGVWMSCNNTVLEIRDHIKHILKESKEETVESWHKKSHWQRFKCWFLHIFAPFM